MRTLLLFFLLAQYQPPHLTVAEIMNPSTYGGQSGVAKIPRHWYDFHKDRDGLVTVKLKADLRAPIYHVSDVTDPKADFQVIDPSYAHANHFSIRGKKGHLYRWSVAGRP